MANETKYWKGIAQLNDEKFVEKHQSEFAEYIPVEEFIGDSAKMESSSTNRRDFLKFLGFSTVAATLAACETPVMKTMPYVQRPEEIIPGVANWYASTFFDGHDYASVLVKTREGRPIKIEANPLSKITGDGKRGGLNARVQSSVLSLYDSTRLQGAKMKNGSAWVSKSWQDADAALGPKFAQSKGIAIISSTIASPSTKAAIAEFAAKYKNVRHVTYDAISYSGILKANNSTFGSAFIPTYNFDKADVIVSLGCDFLVNWLSPVEHARQYGLTRKVGTDKKAMSKHYQFESILSVTGSNADERFPVKPSQLGAVALGILSGLGGSASASAAVMTKEVGKVVDALKNAKGKALVVSGSNDPAIQVVVNEINRTLGSYGTTINTDIKDLTHQGDDSAFKKAVDDFGTAIDTVIFYNTNPVYSAPGALKFADAMKKLSLRVSFASHTDETASACDWILPDHHYLEAWNDYYPRTRQFSLQQPAIRPLFDTRHAQESFLTWAGNNSDYHSYIQKMWKMNAPVMDFTSYWNNSVRDGVVDMPMAVVVDKQDANPKPAAKPAADSTANVNAQTPPPNAMLDAVAFTGGTLSLSDAASQINAIKGGTYELSIYQKTSMGSGNQSQNPWLQEMPDPITKITWDNYVTMNPSDVQALKLFGVEDDILVRFDELEDALDIVEVTANGVKTKLPVWFQPGQTKGTIGIAVGYGRTGFNEVIDAVGKNIYPSVGWNEAGGTMEYNVYNVSVAATGDEQHEIASTQVHGTIMGRNEDLLRETTLTNYSKDERAGNPKPTMETYAGEKDVEDVNLWNSFERPNHKWALAIDLNSCIGCGACVVSCNAENNVAVVGKDQVRRSREMHWIRIDRYYSSDTVKEVEEDKGDMGTKEMYRKMESPTFDNPKVVFQPLMCQHCNHAPCETVCPVLATNHSSEGLNQMVYNRCVGTRYCANNCPFKVRRFNWFNYVEYDKFKDINPAQDLLGRMVLNPDVVVRSRGVMEKCSMCVQRIQAGKLDAKKASRRPIDGEIQTACSQSCPTNAIIFGDLNDDKSEVSAWYNSGRKFEMLEELGVRPSVFYLTKVWNREDENAHV
ncbi:MAG TPA: TAT-variant-translocated molybdopterin oxidoreductase [Bacteroidia bacterium]|jgi:molybdopterin-containing oxidoreductase family iron-sulfur binding subunit|nr:TAT-variant-translocated molybdopterin oxidoreductase [Bacteroidia bacterium]